MGFVSAAEHIPRISFEEFLRLEELNASKHEWLNGIMYMMLGGTFEHGRLVDNVLVTLRHRLESAVPALLWQLPGSDA